MGAVKDTRAMIEAMSPELRPGAFAFVTGADESMVAEAIGMFREAEGLSLIVPVEIAPPGVPRMRLITLQVNSSLEGVGLTAAVSAALTMSAIPCNVVAAFHHDHIFVPEDQADDALRVLLALSGNPDGQDPSS